jgi:NAD(P)-dependent dehydrogenase (short-subunit alcohol dehydrogenase family)
MSSVSVFMAQPNAWAYIAAKGAIHTLNQSMALALARYSIRINGVSPGWIRTREADRAARAGRAKWGPAWGQFHMLERCGEPVECAHPILFLLSDNAFFATVAGRPIDGDSQGHGSERIGSVSRFAGTI